jgi:hypothetical protein
MTVETENHQIPDDRKSAKYWQVSRFLQEQFLEIPIIPDDETIRNDAKVQLEAFLSTKDLDKPTYTMVQGETFDPDEHGPGTIVRFQREKVTLQGLEKDTLTTDDYFNSSLWGVICNFPADKGLQTEQGVIVPFVVLSADRKLTFIPDPLIAHQIRVGEVFPGRNALTKITEFSIHREAF